MSNFIISAHSLQFSKGYRRSRGISVQNCDKAGIILKVRKYISKALTSEPLLLRVPSLLLQGELFIGIIKVRYGACIHSLTSRCAKA